MNNETISLSSKQQLFLDTIKEGKNVFLTGKAGTGKSFIVKEAINILAKENKRFVAIAPTGVAANNINGQTIHSLFQISPFGVIEFKDCSYLKSEKRKLIQNIDTIFIDEVSMLRPDILDAINWTMIKNGIESGLEGKQIIFVGDMKQLPPPIDDNMRSVLCKTYSGEQFHHAQIYSRLNVTEIELDEVLRQSDPEFIDSLNQIRDGNRCPYFYKFVGKPAEGIILAPHNATVAEYNQQGLHLIDSQEIVFDAKVEGNVKAEEFNVESKIVMKDGAKIMYLANSKENPLINGTIGTFKVINDTYFISVSGENFQIKPIIFTKKEYVFNSSSNRLELKEIGSITQMPIKLAYAISIHKSQGLTFDKVTVDIRKPCFSPGQLYVALSRVTSPDGLTIIL